MGIWYVKCTCVFLLDFFLLLNQVRKGEGGRVKTIEMFLASLLRDNKTWDKAGPLVDEGVSREDRGRGRGNWSAYTMVLALML